MVKARHGVTKLHPTWSTSSFSWHSTAIKGAEGALTAAFARRGSFSSAQQDERRSKVCGKKNEQMYVSVLLATAPAGGIRACKRRAKRISATKCTHARLAISILGAWVERGAGNKEQDVGACCARKQTLLRQLGLTAKTSIANLRNFHIC